MPHAFADRFQEQLATLAPGDSQFAVEAVDLLLALAQEARASDLHLVPAAEGMEILLRIDGVLHPITRLATHGVNIVTRLKVLADLLTYRTDVPQEGRIRSDRISAGRDPKRSVRSDDGPEPSTEVRVSTFPTLFGEKCVVRLFAGSGQLLQLADLGFPIDVETQFRQLLTATSGVVMVTGPAGSGKTTTLYAAIRHILDSAPHRPSIATLEDPIETVVPGIAQSHVHGNSGFDYATGLKSLMRQDPDVIMVGEIRDQETAQTVFQASLTGQLVLTTFHAGRSAEAIARMLDMGIEPYLLRSSLLGIMSQRLVRKLCSCAVESTDPLADRGDLPVERCHVAQGCDQCRQTGYRGRLVLAELLRPDLQNLGRAILSRTDADEIEALAIDAGLVTLPQQACTAVETGATTPAEVLRVFGTWRADSMGTASVQSSRVQSVRTRPAIEAKPT